MDYKSILSLAEKNQEMKDANEFIVKKRSNGGYTSGPKKSAIDAFKARKEREEMEKQRERQREKDRLMAMRSQNSKSMKKAKMMQTRTKDNDFSRILLTDSQIEEQKRVEEKLKLKGTQDLVQIKKSREDKEDKVVRNAAKSSGNNRLSDNVLQNKASDKSVKTKDVPKKPPPKPSMSYEQLLSLATEKTKTEKTSLIDDITSHVEEKKQMRPMTQKEKDRLKEEMYYKQRAHKGLARLPDAERHKQLNQKPVSRDMKRTPDYSKKTDNYKNSNTSNTSNNNNNNTNNSYTGSSNKLVSKTVSNVTETQTKCDRDFKRPNVYNSSSNARDYSNNESVMKRPPNDRPRAVANSSNDSRRMAQSSASNKSAILNKMSQRLNTRDKEYNERVSNASNASNASKERLQLNTYKEVNKRSNERARPPSPPPPPRRQMPPMPKLPPIGSTYRRGMYEDVSEYMDEDYEEEDDDDDMADFIDDGPAEVEDNEYSSAIREIFGYDKRKYRNIDDDDIEESSFAECMKEDVRSAKIGLLEDLEEERKEEEERQRYLAQKKRLNQQRR